MSHAPESVSVVQESTTTFDRSQFATAAQRFREDLVVSIERFLKQRAVDIVMEGTFVLPNWYDPEGKLRTFACRATRVSPFRMMVEVPVVGKVGDNLTSYFRDIGNFEGTISDTARGGVLLELEMTQAMRAKLADKLTWLEKKTKDPASITDARKTPRFIPKAAVSTRRWPTAAFTVATFSTPRCQAPPWRPRQGRRSECRWASVPASAV